MAAAHAAFQLLPEQIIEAIPQPGNLEVPLLFGIDTSLSPRATGALLLTLTPVS
jgi:hypothetical protein